ncbi:MAG TPA: nucleotidyltransferase family protein [Alphaproteobacteria bacterium]|nr:nucleotidyltransferase family protein [Alphaproteobacteria bacterium]
MKIERGMVLAAGFGQRMRPLTLTTPKPLIPVAGRCMLDRVLDHFIAAGVESCAVNSHYLADRIAMHVALRMSQKREKLGILLSHEDEILDTGGGVLQALPVFQPDPFFVVNGDILWRDGAVPALERLAAAWNDETMDALLLVHDSASAIGYDGPGDFDLLPTGKLKRRQGNSAPFVFTGVQVLHPRLFDGVEKGVFSLNVLYDKALAAGRLHGLLHDGEWYHIGTPDGLKLAESHLKAHLS